jgi:pimeloyl-ACP methyl ester carboxylesterase
VWEFALEMTRGVFARLWRHPASQEVDPDRPLLGRLAEVTTPTLVITGRSDVRYIQQVSDRLADGIPGAHRIDLDDVAHLPPLERPTEVNTALLDFLDNYGSGSQAQ